MQIATIVIANILKLNLKLQCNLQGSKINVRIFFYIRIEKKNKCGNCHIKLFIFKNYHHEN